MEEFCCHGNLRDYLVTCRQHFVNELTGNGVLGPPQNKEEQINHEERYYKHQFHLLNCGFYSPLYKILSF